MKFESILNDFQCTIYIWKCMQDVSHFVQDSVCWKNWHFNKAWPQVTWGEVLISGSTTLAYLIVVGNSPTTPHQGGTQVYQYITANLLLTSIVRLVRFFWSLVDTAEVAVISHEIRTSFVLLSFGWVTGYVNSLTPVRCGNILKA